MPGRLGCGRLQIVQVAACDERRRVDGVQMRDVSAVLGDLLGHKGGREISERVSARVLTNRPSEDENIRGRTIKRNDIFNANLLY